MPGIDREDVRKLLDVAKHDAHIEDGQCVLNVERLTDHLYGNLAQIEVANKFERRQGVISAEEISRRFDEVKLPRAAEIGLGGMTELGAFSYYRSRLEDVVTRASQCDPEAMFGALISAGQAKAKLGRVHGLVAEVQKTEDVAAELLGSALTSCGCEFEVA